MLYSEGPEEAMTKGVSLQADTLAILREAANLSKVVLILHDEQSGGVLEAVLWSALEGAGLVGDSQGQIPKHRLLTCTTHVGKIAIVRQLESSMHFESDEEVYSELSRFRVKQCLVRRGHSTLLSSIEQLKGAS
eukprot:TRINITY_DN29598_c0_g1_i1.p1 TRINITY_DN29598_c0_g1~~TRINITY_DN29598_c0_g1_i1.p1  ORF type:complete len:144 (+),score=2.95 TRINITY_DN29598_c0_g1_i1:31-432(+)